MKKSSNLWKIIWIIGIFIILSIILYLVILYKVEWEDKDLNTYLYFYDCNSNLCTSTSKFDEYYNKIVCEDDICPYITNINDENLTLQKESISWIYNYVENKVINNAYNDYRYIDDDLYVFTDKNEKQGVLSLNDGVLFESKYDCIDDYLNGLISYKSNGLYGIVSVDDLYNVSPEYDEIVLINNKLFAGEKDNIYKIYSYENNMNNEDTYNYVYAKNEFVFVFNNNKLDILDNNLNSLLLMKVETFYKYTIEKERESLNFNFDGENISFDVFTSEKEYSTYKFNIVDKKLV